MKIFAHNFVQRCNTWQTEDGNYKTAFSLYNVVKSAATTATSSSGFDEMKMWSMSNTVMMHWQDDAGLYGAYRPDHVIHQRRCNTNQPGPNGQLVAAYAPPTPPTTQYREHGPSLASQHSVWLKHPHGTLCASLWEGLTVLGLLNAIWKRTFYRLTRLCSVLIFHRFIDSNARPVRLVVDLALNKTEHWTLKITDIKIKE